VTAGTPDDRSLDIEETWSRRTHDPHDTVRKIAEDAFLLAHNIKEGDLGEEIEDGDDELAIRAKREWRAMELVINLGERLCRVTGVEDPWVPSSIQHLTEV
jgi:hypothetical protein